MPSCPPTRVGPGMGRTGDFAKRWIIGSIVFWAVVLVLVRVLYEGEKPTEASLLFVVALALTVSFAVRRRMKRRQRAARAAETQRRA